MTGRTLDFLFTNWEGGGNITPVLEVVRKLRARGHQVRFMSDACNRPEAEAAGAQFIPWTRAPSRADRTAASQTVRDWEGTPEEGLRQALKQVVCEPALAYAQDTLDELRRAPADLVVTFELVLGPLAACESIGQRAVVLSPGIALMPIPGVPPLGPGLAPARSAEEQALHAQIATGVTALFDSDLATYNQARAALGLPPLAHLFDQRHAACAELLATSRAFDFAPAQLPARIRYVGPQIGDPAWAAPWRSPWPADDTRPLVLVGFSTTFQNHARVLQNVIDALAPLDARVLMTLGGSIEPGELTPAANTAIVASAPHGEVMREAQLAITHGGHGTVIRGLANGLPMLVIPHGRDQNDNAARVTERGAGLSLPPSADVAQIRAAAQRLLADAGFRRAARALGERIAHDAEHSDVVAALEAAACTMPASAAA